MERIVRMLIFGLAAIDAVALLGRGSDYLTGDASQQIRDFDTTGATTVWGIMCIIPALGLLTAVATKNLRRLMWAGITTAIAYFCFGVVSVGIVLTPPLDDWRLTFDCFTATVRWALIATITYAYLGVLTDRQHRQEGDADGNLDQQPTAPS